MEDDQQPGSLVCVSASELYPKKPLQTDDEGLQVNFPELSGEGVEFLAATSDAALALSNFRLFINFKNSFLNIPLRLIESVELRDLFILQINCKDARSFRIVFDSNEQSVEWLHKLSPKILPHSRIEEVFAFAYHAWDLDTKQSCPAGNCTDFKGICQQDGVQIPQYSFLDEAHRMGFDTDLDNSPWRITDVNSNYEVCRTYPKLHITPANITDSELEKVASFRCSGRFPSVVWRHMTNGAVIARCSQPEVGWFVWRNSEDEMLIQAIGNACARDYNPAIKKALNSNRVHVNGITRGHAVNGDISTADEMSVGPKMKQVLIVDARSYTAAYANRSKGGGFEYTEYYPNCEVMFMNLANIHGIRKSFHSLRTLCSGSQDLPNWWSLLEKTNWLHHISMVIKAAMTVVHSIHNDGRPVVVHCSDGWDRTTQIVALAELLLDPYYRTIEGFKILVDREWLEFGHRFADRCGHGPDMDENERSPVFLQWLDCVHQLLRQFPCSFEFNETFLVKLLQHTYTCLYGTFLGNNEYERHRDNIKARTLSVWSYIMSRKREFRNLLYTPGGDQVLEPSCHVRSLQLWSAVFLAYPTPFVGLVSSGHPEPTSSPCTTPTSPRFPFNYSDSNLELKSSIAAPLNGSKSDGELASCARNSSCKNCQNICTENHSRPVENSYKDSSDLKNGSCCRCRSSVVNSNGVRNGVLNGIASDPESSKSMYYSTAGESLPEGGGKGLCVENHVGAMVNSMSSSTATVILEHSETGSDSETGTGSESEKGSDRRTENNLELTGSNSETGNETVTDTESTLMENCNGHIENSEPSVVNSSIEEVTTDVQHLNASSYEDLTPQSKEKELLIENSEPKNSVEDCRTSYEENNPDELDNSSNKVTGNSSKDCASTIETSTQTSVSAGSQSAETQTSESLTTLRPNPSSIFARYLDSDGLTAIPDPVQSRLRQIEMAYHAQIEALHAQVLEERRRRLLGDMGSPGRASDLADEVCSLPDSTQSGEHPPLSYGSADETSWTQIDEGEAEPTRWVPDHAATNCAKCATGFWIANRKHHCRNCGQVFCSTCSGHSLPVPNEQLYDPVRVCVTCFNKLVSMETRENGGRRPNHEVNSVPG